MQRMIRVGPPARWRHRHWLPAVLICALIGAMSGLATGCAKEQKREDILSKMTSRYQALPDKKVPVYLKDTILERCDLGNFQPFPVSAFGLVVNLHGTGDTFAGTAVREHIIKEMIVHQFGSKLYGSESMQPETVLSKPEVAIVEVDGFIPPGARKFQPFDVYVKALEGNNTSSLSHGLLYRTDLKKDGANMLAPSYAVDVLATAEGSIFVNPAYALNDSITESEVRTSLRKGTMMNGGIVLMDRPLTLRLRRPQLSIARTIQYRINQAFQSTNVSAAKDEAMIVLYVPDRYGTDWEHFAQVAMHLFLNPSTDFTIVKARQLIEEANKPDAPLLDISYCWEAMGPAVLTLIEPLMRSDKPEVAYAASRAGAFLGDVTAQEALVKMAQTTSHPFQIPAVQTLAKLPSSPNINQMLGSLLDADQAMVRIEAYRALAANGDSRIISRQILRSDQGLSFALDIVPSKGPPLVYASRTGVPRIAVMGDRLQVDLPMLFTAIDTQLMISSEKDRPLLNIFYRGKEMPNPVSMTSSPDLAEVIARLGGEGAPGEARLRFNYCDTVSLVQAMSDQHKLWAPGQNQTRVPVTFVLQEAPQMQQTIEEAPMIPDQPPQPSPPAGDQLGPVANHG